MKNIIITVLIFCSCTTGIYAQISGDSCHAFIKSVYTQYINQALKLDSGEGSCLMEYQVEMRTRKSSNASLQTVKYYKSGKRIQVLSELAETFIDEFYIIQLIHSDKKILITDALEIEDQNKNHTIDFPKALIADFKMYDFELVDNEKQMHASIIPGENIIKKWQINQVDLVINMKTRDISSVSFRYSEQSPYDYVEYRYDVLDYEYQGKALIGVADKEALMTKEQAKQKYPDYEWIDHRTSKKDI